MKDFTKNSILSAAIFSVAVGISTGVAAGELENTYIEESAVGVRTVRLEYVAAELGTEEGRAELTRRISMAAKEVCGPLSLHAAGGLKSLSRNRACYEDARSAALSQVDQYQTASTGN